jgi:hypothetical protein
LVYLVFFIEKLLSFSFLHILNNSLNCILIFTRIASAGAFKISITPVFIHLVPKNVTWLLVINAIINIMNNVWEKQACLNVIVSALKDPKNG